ncbi:alpha-L-fucosidase [Reichenbachiella agariperforans]|uniref:alpha-L-fucosidase n=1 Tax=Reichenbachiella agariperforans TaxID=156994 RepID=A0A1M6UF66_REIAG|nr:alpha-L-fucosidase [Reichenbachiella agariperforans]SHK67854.1 alpha-L-fucosidase [Reichenbachiella agariperforans]
MKRNNWIYSLIIFGLCACTANPEKKESQVMEEKPYTADWSSLQQHQTPEWFLDAKFGIYFHWGPYSVPAYQTEWYSHWMYVEDHPVRKHHEETYGSLDEFGYKDFIPMFTASQFDADEWAELFKKSGAQFAGPVAEHADGFAMWDSQLTEWDAVDMGPKRDIVGEMEKAIRKQGMKFVATYHRHWMYAWYPTWDTSVDAGDTQFEGLYGPKVPEGTFVMADKPTNPLPDDAFNQEWLDRLDELMDKYQPDMIWFDNKMDIIGEEYRQQFLANYYNKAEEWGQEVVCTYKFTDMAKGSAVLDLERARMSEKKDFPWLTDDSIDWKAWSHIANPKYKSTNRLIDFLVDVVSKNGAVLLNIPPTADGVIEQEVRDRLLEMGEWLSVNGEAIYGTRPWKIYGEGPQEIVEGHLSENKNPDAVAQDIRFTTKGDALYAIALDWPESGKLMIRSLGTDQELLDETISQVELLGYKGKIKWVHSAEGLEITLPEEPVGQHAFALKIAQ